MNRPNKKIYGCAIALTASIRSEDPDTKTGVAIEDFEGRIIAVGYNGLKSGLNAPFDLSKNRDKKLDYMIHAETNALSLIRRGEGKILYTVLSPCVDCCKNIVAHGIQEVVYIREYHRETKFKEVLSENGVIYNQILEEEVKKYLTFLP